MLQNITATSARANRMAKNGRNGDTMMAHVTPGEIVVPHSAQTPEVVNTISRTMQMKGLPMGRYVVGNKQNSINPSTGTQEHFGLKNLVKGAIGAVSGFATGGPVGAAMGGLSGAFSDEMQGGKQSGSTTGTPSASIGSGSNPLANLPSSTTAGVLAGKIQTPPVASSAELRQNTVSPDTSGSGISAFGNDQNDIITKLINAITSTTAQKGIPEFYDAMAETRAHLASISEMNRQAGQQAAATMAQGNAATTAAGQPANFSSQQIDNSNTSSLAAVNSGRAAAGQPAITSLDNTPKNTYTAPTVTAAPASKKTITNITQKTFGSTAPAQYGQKNYDGDTVIYSDGTSEPYANFFAREIGNQYKGGSDFKSYIGKGYGSSAPAPVATSPAAAPAQQAPASAIPSTASATPLSNVSVYYEPKYLNEVIARELGYEGGFGGGGASAFLDANPAKRAEFNYLLSQRGGNRELTAQDRQLYSPTPQPAQDPDWLVALRSQLEKAVSQAQAAASPAPAPAATTSDTTTALPTSQTVAPVVTKTASSTPIRSSRFGTRRYKGSLARNF